MKMTKSKLKEIIKQSIIEEREYDVYFKGMLAKYGVDSPADLSDEEKSKFFSDVDKGWDAKNEGNSFGAAVTSAKEKGEDQFQVDGKTYPVKESTNSSFMNEVTLRKGAKIRINIENRDVTYKLIDTKYWTTSYQGGFTARWEVIRSTHPKVKVGTIEEMHPNEVKKLLKSGIATVVTESNEFINEPIKGTKNESVNKEIKVGSTIIVNHPTLKKPFEGKVKFVLKAPTGLVYVLPGDKGVWDEKWVSLKESKDFTSIREVIRGIILNERKYDLMFGKLGNGITVSNRKVSDPSTKDYKKVAHISNDGKIQWYDKDAQRDSSVRGQVEKFAKSMNEGNGITMNNLDWGKTTAERNRNLDKYDSLKTQKEKDAFLKSLKDKSVNESDCGCGNTSIVEGNAFGAAVTAAKKAGQKEFEFNGKTYKVKKGSYEKNEANKESVNESKKLFSVNKFPIGNVKYSINTYDGKKNKDGSPHIGIITAKSKKELELKIRDIHQNGYDEVNDVATALKKESVNEAKFYAFFNGKKHEIEGDSLYDAKQKAITQLKVPKSKVGLLAIVNAGEHEKGSFKFD
jgi:hypothetical protein